MIASLFSAGDQNRTPLQASDNRKKISFRWNSRTFHAGSLVVASKSVEQQPTVFTDSNKLVPYDDDVSDNSEAEKDAAETTTNTSVMTTDVNTNTEHCADICENTCSLTAVFATNGQTGDVASTSSTEKLLKLAQLSETSENNHLPDCNRRLLLPGDNNCGTNNTSESSPDLLTVPQLESTVKVAVPLLPDTAEDGLTALVNGDLGCETVHTKPAADDDGSACQVNPVQNNHPSSDSNAISHLAAGRKRRSRHKLKEHHVKHRRHHTTQITASAVYSSDEEVEYVWVEKTAETMAQQPTGWFRLLLVLLLTINIRAAVPY